MTGMTGANGSPTRPRRLIAVIRPAAMTACHLVLSLVLHPPGRHLAWITARLQAAGAAL